MHFGSVVLFFIFVHDCSSIVPLEVFHQRPSEYHLHHHRLSHNNAYLRKKIATMGDIKILYQTGTSDADLPECGLGEVCNKIDMYDSPWMEKQCKCSKGLTCPTSPELDDGYTLLDKTRQYKLCEPVKRLPKCKYFRDVTWTVTLHSNNLTEQIVNCHCPKNSVIYLLKRQADRSVNKEVGFQYSFGCSPQSKIRCQRKEPCRLFTVRKRQEFIDEANTNTLCLCPHAHRCPHHHMDYGVIAGKSYLDETIRTYSGYCLPTV